MKETYSQSLRASGIAMEELSMMRRKNQIGDATMRVEIEKVWLGNEMMIKQMVLMEVESRAKEAGIKLTEAQRDNIMVATEQAPELLDIKRDFNEALRSGARWQYAGQVTGKVLDIAGSVMTRGLHQGTPTQPSLDDLIRRGK